MTGRTASDAGRCRLCGSAGARWLTQGDRELWRCGSCGFGWVPQGIALHGGVSIYEHDDPIFLRDGNAAYYLDEQNLVNARAKVEWTRRFRPGGRLLDVGANFGHFVAEASAHYDACGVEPSRVACEWAERHLGVRLVPATVEDFDWSARPPFDVVTMWDVIEHLANPSAALTRVHAALPTGGLLCLATPDMGSFVARVLGRHWHYLDLVQHVSLFNRRNLARLLDRHGFRLIGTRTFGRVYATSYIGARLKYLGRASAVWRLAAAAGVPVLSVAGDHLSVNLGDVMGVAAEKVL